MDLTGALRVGATGAVRVIMTNEKPAAEEPEVALPNRRMKTDRRVLDNAAMIAARRRRGAKRARVAVNIDRANDIIITSRRRLLRLPRNDRRTERRVEVAVTKRVRKEEGLLLLILPRRLETMTPLRPRLMAVRLTLLRPFRPTLAAQMMLLDMNPHLLSVLQPLLQCRQIRL